MIDRTEMAEDVKRNLALALVSLEDLVRNHTNAGFRESARLANDDVFNALSLIHYGKPADDLELKEVEELSTLIEDWADTENSP
jgi:hypothetical protein